MVCVVYGVVVRCVFVACVVCGVCVCGVCGVCAPVEEAEGTWAAAWDHCAGHCRFPGPSGPVSCQPDGPVSPGGAWPERLAARLPRMALWTRPGSTRQGGDPAEGPTVPRPAALRGPLIPPLHGPGGAAESTYGTQGQGDHVAKRARDPGPQRPALCGFCILAGAPVGPVPGASWEAATSDAAPRAGRGRPPPELTEPGRQAGTQRCLCLGQRPRASRRTYSSLTHPSSQRELKESCLAPSPGRFNGTIL